MKINLNLMVMVVSATKIPYKDLLNWLNLLEIICRPYNIVNQLHAVDFDQFKV